MVLTGKESETAKYKGKMRVKMDPPNLNTHGWKVCHIVRVGLNDKTPVTSIAIETLTKHLCAFLNPCNIFLVPKVYGSLGELPEFIEAFCENIGGDKNH